ncbi:hypothetical protein Tco_0319720 [Tanacetum coccineum]
MYKEYLVEFWYSANAFENSKVSFSIPTGGIYGEVGVNTFRNAIGAHYLPHSSEYVAPPSIDVVRHSVPTIEYGASSALALQLFRRLGSIFASVYAAVQKLKNDSWKELQFSLVDNSKLNKYTNSSNPLPLKGPLGHQTVAIDYFFNNDLEYLKTSDPKVTYTTSIMKTKAARYEIKGIEDMVPTLWSTIKHAYDKDASMGIKHWGERRKLWYRSQVSKFSKQNVYSTKAILGVKSVSVKKLHGYGHLEEIVVKRSDQQLYKFKEGDFVDLHLNDIEDMLLLAVQHKLFHLDGSDIVDFIVALRMFTRSLILKRRVKDLQLGVESYQKKLNITKPQKTFPEIEFKEPYTPSYDPPGIVYEDLDKQKRVLRADELYKFSDGTLKSVRDEIHHRVLDFRLDYNPEMPKRKWTAVDRKRSGLMIELIDKQLREREIIRNLERLVGARELEMDYKLMTRTV